MGNLSNTNAIISLITLFQNIGSAIDFSKFPVTAKVKEWAGSLKNFLNLLQNKTIGYLNSHDFRLIMAVIVFSISIITFIPSFLQGIRFRHLIIRYFIYFMVVVLCSLITMLNVPLLVKILVPLIVPYLAFLMRFICCRCYKNMFDDLKFAPSEEQFTMQKTIITTEMDPEEYLKTVRERALRSKNQFFGSILSKH